MDRIFRLNSTLGENIETYATRLSAALIALGEIALVDFTLTMKTQGVYQATVGYREGALPGTTIRAVGFQRAGSPTASQQAANTFFQANPTYRGVFVRSINPQDTHDLQARQLLILYSTLPLAQLPTSESQAVILLAAANIAPSAVGLASIVNGVGALTPGVVVQNRGTNAWLAGTTATGYYDLAAGAWFAYPSCC